MRKLSYYQTKPWMDKIAKNRKYKNQAKGTFHPNSRLDEQDIFDIRSAAAGMRKWFCRFMNISERHWYMIRSKKRWVHI